MATLRNGGLSEWRTDTGVEPSLAVCGPQPSASLDVCGMGLRKLIGLVKSRVLKRCNL